MKKHDLKNIVINNIRYSYFYERLKSSRYKISIIDPDAPALYEIIFHGYEFLIADRVARFIEDAQNGDEE